MNIEPLWRLLFLSTAGLALVFINELVVDNMDEDIAATAVAGNGVTGTANVVGADEESEGRRIDSLYLSLLENFLDSALFFFSTTAATTITITTTTTISVSHRRTNINATRIDV